MKKEIVIVHTSDVHVDHEYTARQNGGDGAAPVVKVLEAARAAHIRASDAHMRLVHVPAARAWDQHRDFVALWRIDRDWFCDPLKPCAARC